ncbi:family 51 glycoside hydrolase [Melampsora larici-populina 98AG31]|uniref:non-reducing end alpha-L-arabinofuranosidase n=1 Tax=Melampsora larici-populina (strain 98AG31 / pathotype 3-4-7) TaxID=747676 RepID=F4RED3_MELLP|nr:family 51 glycoside hydrolase [Melampsora larici-populina 98AG31]EGG09072.1 family 51 glycoside hydrolase [Melampsora larici-populina 98AG31]
MRKSLAHFPAYLSLSLALILQSQAQNGGPTVITLEGKPAQTIPNLYGMMYEDINHAGDGGLYAELLRNRALQGKNPKNQADALEAWSSNGNIKLAAVDLSGSLPLSEALPNALEVTVAAGQQGSVVNSGYWGIKVDQAWTYTASFYAKIATKGTKCGPGMSVQLLTTGQSGTILAQESIQSSCLTDTWQKFDVQLRPKNSAADAKNDFAIAFTSTSNADEVIHITLASLFPPTFKNRPNGVRIDLAQATAALKRSFFRWGGNNIEGYSAGDRWKWDRTVGPLTDRPGRKGNWGYTNTDGFGLFEVLQFCEDLNMEFIASVWSGLSLSPFKAVPESEIDKYIQEGVDMLNFIVGPASTKAGALRASLGHPEPFPVRFVEVGNEDFFDSATYSYRWGHLAPALMQQFPQLKFVATNVPHKPDLQPEPYGWDIHSYQTAEWYVAHTQDYDSYPRNGQKIFQLESKSNMSQFASNGPKIGQGPARPTQEGAVGEAAYMTGFERNSDIVEGIAYAPSYINVQVPEASQWHPNLLGFELGDLFDCTMLTNVHLCLVSALRVYPTTSYYVQQMFATYLGDKYLPSNLPSKTDKLSWSATVSSSDDRSTRQVSINLPFTPGQVTTSTLQSSGNADSPPVTQQVPAQASPISLSLSSQSVTVVIIARGR